MKIGLSAITFAPGAMGGMETYLRNLLDRLQQIDCENDYTILCDRRVAGEIPLHNDRWGTRAINYGKPSLNWFLRGLLRNTVNVDILVREMKSLDLDVIHHPFTVLTPPGIRTPSVLTFWDMQHEFFPEFFNQVELRKRRRIYPASAREATRIIVSASFTKDCLVERYGIEEGKIHVIHTGYGPVYRVIEDEPALEEVRRRYGLDRPFLFYPAATWPHKNHGRLLAALRLLKEQGFDGRLLLTGIAMQSHGEVLREIDRQGLAGEIQLLGYVPAVDLPLLYNLARALVFPSLFEGFGIPLVEAMACGCPVVCARATSLPEVAGEAGVLFDPYSVEDIAEKVGRVWADDGLRRDMAALGLQRAKLFTWEETAQKTLQVYREAVG